jgi:Putative Ice-binding-like adhesive domain
MNLNTRSLFTLIAVASVALASNAIASVVDLGSAAGFVVLTYNSNNTSDTAFNGGRIGVVNGNWTQSGGGETDLQQPTTVYLSPGFTNNGPSVETTVYNSALLNQAWTDAMNASATLASLAPTQTFGAITSAMTISESVKGNYVFDISSINLNQSALTLSAPAGSTFVLDISGNITLNGGSQGNGILVAGGLKSSDVFINLTGADSNLTTTGGGNAQQIFGTVLATGINASVNLHPGQINGEVIARTLTTSSGALVVVPEKTPSPAILGFIGLVVAFGSRRALLRRAVAVAAERNHF